MLFRIEMGVHISLTRTTWCDYAQVKAKGGLDKLHIEKFTLFARMNWALTCVT
jgi:hypothetical protein